MIVRQDTLCIMAKIGQWHVNNVNDSNMHEAKVLHALAKECVPKVTVKAMS